MSEKIEVPTKSLIEQSTSEGEDSKRIRARKKTYYCRHDGCTKVARAGGKCINHGGGKRCGHEGCMKSAQTGGYCWRHGGGNRCGHEGCAKDARKSGYCTQRDKNMAKEQVP